MRTKGSNKPIDIIELLAAYQLNCATNGHYLHSCCRTSAEPKHRCFQHQQGEKHSNAEQDEINGERTDVHTHGDASDSRLPA